MLNACWKIPLLQLRMHLESQNPDTNFPKTPHCTESNTLML